MIKCPNCGKRNPNKNKFCGDCGTDLSEAQMHCLNCGTIHVGGEKFCTECGDKLITQKEYEMINLIIEEERLEKEKRQQKVIEENKRKKLLYRKLYVNFVDEDVEVASKYLGLNSSSKDTIIKALIEVLGTEERINAMFRDKKEGNCPRCGYIVYKFTNNQVAIKCPMCGHTFWL